MTATTTNPKATNDKAKTSGPTKQPPPSPAKASGSGQKPSAGQKPGTPTKTKEPKRFSVEESDFKISEAQELVHLSQEKALYLHRKLAKEGIVTKGSFMKELNTNPADKDIDAVIMKAVVWTSDNEKVKAKDEWTDAADVRRSFIKYFSAK